MGEENPSMIPRFQSNSRAGAIRLFAVLWIGGIVLAVGVVIVIGTYLRGSFREPYKGPTYTVKAMPMQVTIVERGSLESAENSEIIVRVKAGTKGSTIASIIKSVVEEGTEVKFGDKLVELDDS